QALNVSVENGKLDVEFKFADGWRLEYVKSSADATAALASWVDLVKTTLTSAKDVATAALGKTEEEEETEEPNDDGDTKAQANKDTKRVRTEKNVVRTQKITETWLHPGVYALFNRNNNDCASRPVLKTDWYSGNTFTRTREQNDGSEQKSQVITQ
ncbi:MAG TPA: hypothetical protein VEU33_06470, partial [Archangium sp.]|nr:hypothetical protein [Archangium sp.]